MGASQNSAGLLAWRNFSTSVSGGLAPMTFCGARSCSVSDRPVSSFAPWATEPATIVRLFARRSGLCSSFLLANCGASEDAIRLARSEHGPDSPSVLVGDRLIRALLGSPSLHSRSIVELSSSRERRLTLLCRRTARERGTTEGLCGCDASGPCQLLKVVVRIPDGVGRSPPAL